MQEKLETILRKTLKVILCTTIEDLVLFLIRFITCICLYMPKKSFAKIEILFGSSILEFNWAYRCDINLFLNF